MRLFSTAQFDKEYKKLPAHVQKKAKKQLGLLVEFGAVYPSLRFKIMQKYRREKFYELSITKNYRIILQKRNGDYSLLRVGTHRIVDKF